MIPLNVQVLTPCLLVVAGERALVEDGSVAADEGPVRRLQHHRLRLVQQRQADVEDLSRIGGYTM